jgi:hypothetical protein
MHKLLIRYALKIIWNSEVPHAELGIPKPRDLAEQQAWFYIVKNESVFILKVWI